MRPSEPAAPPITVRLLCAILLLATLVPETKPASAPPTPAPPVPRLRFSPLDIAAIRSISPLGNLNPRGGHVFPTDHIYLDYGRQPGLPVFAPAEGVVLAIHGQSGHDFKIEVKVNGRFSYYVAHVFVDKAVKLGGTVDGGQVLGVTSGSGSLDLGCIDADVTWPGFANPKRYPSPTLHAVPPLKYYDEPLRSQLYEKVDRFADDKDGKIDCDLPGTLMGNWFLEGLSVRESARGEPAVWTQQLAFIPDARRRGAIRISIGGTVAPAGVYQADDRSPDPATVTPSTGKAAFKVRWRESKETREGVLLVQMLAGDRIKVQFFSEARPDSVEFTSAASVYLR